MAVSEFTQLNNRESAVGLSEGGVIPGHLILTGLRNPRPELAGPVSPGVLLRPHILNPPRRGLCFLPLSYGVCAHAPALCPAWYQQ